MLNLSMTALAIFKTIVARLTSRRMSDSMNDEEKSLVPSCASIRFPEFREAGEWKCQDG